MVKNACSWDVDLEEQASEYDAGYYGKLLEKAREGVAFVFGQ